jgi:CheY-like chemotaxis protein
VRGRKSAADRSQTGTNANLRRREPPLKITPAAPVVYPKMDDPMLYYRAREGTRELHVLLAESDPVELKRTGMRLLAAGCVVSTCRTAQSLFETIERLEPDLVLLDPLMPRMDLVALLSRCNAGTQPPIALHSKVLEWVLRAVLDLKSFAGVIRKTDNDGAFQEAFWAIADTVQARKELDTLSLAPAASGTHRIGEARVLPMTPRRIGRGA